MIAISSYSVANAYEQPKIPKQVSYALQKEFPLYPIRIQASCIHQKHLCQSAVQTCIKK